MRPKRRKVPREPVRTTAPPEVPEVVSGSPPAPPKVEPDPIPEHIRRMLEAAYT
jgi:hypothetical protein